MLHRFLCVLLAGFSIGVSATEDLYTIDDLRALEEQQAWAELTAHLTDIRPSQRDEGWNQLLEKAATGYLQSEVQASSSERVIAVARELMLVYPQLKQSSSFKSLFSKHVVASFEPCIEYRIQSCIDDYGRMIRGLELGAATLLDQGRRVYQNAKKSSAVPFFAELVEMDSSYCKDPVVVNALLHTLSLENNTRWPQAQEAVVGACGDIPLPGFEHHLIESEQVRVAICPTYLEKNYVSGIMKQICEQ